MHYNLSQPPCLILVLAGGVELILASPVKLILQMPRLGGAWLRLSSASLQMTQRSVFCCLLSTSQPHDSKDSLQCIFELQ